MELPTFAYVRAESLEEAARLLHEHSGRARLLAGGTELVPRMKYGLDTPEVVIGLETAQAKPFQVSPDGRLRLDAPVTLDALRRSEALRAALPILCDAARAVASKEIRVMGTLGGNLCQETRCLYYNQSHRFQFVEPCFKRGGDRCYFIPKGKQCWAVYMADTAPALLSLDARCTLSNGVEQRTLPLEEIYGQDPLHPLGLSPGEVLTGVDIADVPAKGAGAYQKFTMRGALEFAGVSVAVTLGLERAKGPVTQARIFVGAVGPGPARGRKAEKALEGQVPDERRVAEAAEILADEVRVWPHHGYSAPYLKAILRLKAQEALTIALERGAQG